MIYTLIWGFNPKRGLEIKSVGTECYKLSPMSIQTRITQVDILIFFIIMKYLVKAGQYELVDYMKKHEIVNRIYAKITRAFIKVSKYAD